MTHAEQRLIAFFLVVPAERTVILSERHPQETYPGLWQATAHGGIESGETERSALARELYEETRFPFRDVLQVRRLGEQTIMTPTSRRLVQTVYWMGNIHPEQKQNLHATNEVARFHIVSFENFQAIRMYSNTPRASRTHHFQTPTMFNEEYAVLEDIFEKLLSKKAHSG